MAMPILLRPACSDWPAFCWIEAHPGLAAWLQFLGAVGALAFTYASLRTTVSLARAQLQYQTRHDERQRTESRQSARRELEALHNAAIAAVTQLTNTMDYWRAKLAEADVRSALSKGPKFWISLIEDRNRLLVQFPFERLGDVKAIDDMKRVGECFGLFLKEAEAFLTNEEPERDLSDMTTTCQTATGALTDLRMRLASLVAAQFPEDAQTDSATKVGVR